MKTLAKALIEAAAFLELSGDDIVHTDDAVKMLERIADILHSASTAELAAIRSALRELTEAERAGRSRSDVLKFYEKFCANSGLSHDADCRE